MKNRLILVEGIPGSGKSTIANKIKKYLETQGVKAKIYYEGKITLEEFKLIHLRRWCI